MPESVLDTDKQNQTTFDSLTNKVLAKLVPKLTSQNTPIPFNVHIGIDCDSELFQKHLNSELTQEEAKILHFQTALETPNKLEGVVKFSIDNKTVLWVEDGRVIQDDFDILAQLLADRIIQPMDNFIRAAAGVNLLDYIRSVVETYGSKTSERTITLSGENYVYTLKDERLKVTTKDGNREVLNSDGFTKEATQEDMTALEAFKKLAPEIRGENLSPSVRIKP